MIRILSIDDSKIVLRFLDSILESGACKLTHAYDGPMGIEFLKSDASFDLVLLDWEMPKLTGIQTLKTMRLLGIDVPVIMVTSKNAPEELMAALEAGAAEYVMKPFVPDILIDKIESVLKRSVR